MKRVNLNGTKARNGTYSKGQKKLKKKLPQKITRNYSY